MKDIDIEAFRLPDTAPNVKIVELKKIKPKIKSDFSLESWFIQGPLPGSWMETAANLPGHSLHVALAIWYVRGLAKNKNKIVLERFHLNRFSVKKDSARRALQRLQDAGLIEYHKSGHKFIITVLKATSKNPPIAVEVFTKPRGSNILIRYSLF